MMSQHGSIRKISRNETAVHHRARSIGVLVASGSRKHRNAHAGEIALRHIAAFRRHSARRIERGIRACHLNRKFERHARQRQRRSGSLHARKRAQFLQCAVDFIPEPGKIRCFAISSGESERQHVRCVEAWRNLGQRLEAPDQQSGAGQ